MLPTHPVQTLELTNSFTAQKLAVHVEAVPGAEPAGKYVFAAQAMQPAAAELVVYSFTPHVAAHVLTTNLLSPRAL